MFLGPVMKSIGAPSMFPTPGNIFVRDVGAWYNSSIDGITQQNIPKPASISVNDDLFVLVYGNATTTSPVNAADWTLIHTVTFDRFRLWRRKATLTANDEFTIAAHTALCVAVMAAMSNTNAVGDTISVFQSGGVDSTADTTWDVPLIAANTTQDPIAAVWLLQGRGTNTVVATPTITNISPLTYTIAEIAVAQAGEGTVWVHWGFDPVQPSIGYSAFQQTYSPSASAVQWSAFQRLDTVP